MKAVREVLNFIDGKYCRSASTFELRSPIHGAFTATVHEATQPDVDAAVSAARRALHGPWGAYSASERRDLMRRAASLIKSR
ncbi:MAG: aldehyde dehydrogenase family protein, partial [Woeseiaceae bacterium]|nr:aldehyde dehydrogenase family protein [Woeseiaceae bacterium]